MKLLIKYFKKKNYLFILVLHFMIKIVFIPNFAWSFQVR